MPFGLQNPACGTPVKYKYCLVTKRDMLTSCIIGFCVCLTENNHLVRALISQVVPFVFNIMIYLVIFGKAMSHDHVRCHQIPGFVDGPHVADC